MIDINATLVAQMLNFLILVVVLRLVAYKPIVKMLKEREERLSQGLDPAGGKFSELPDLILIDGGRGQLNAALEAMRECGLSIPMFGLAKRVEEIVLPDEETSIFLDRHSEALHLIQRLRDEAHRFGITHHRALRGKASIHSQLEDIPGVGPKRRKALLNRLGSLKAIREASLEELLAVPGMTKPAAEAVLAWARTSTEKKKCIRSRGFWVFINIKKI